MPPGGDVSNGAWADDADLKAKHAKQAHTWLFTLTLSYSALGVIYGDIGTSPLYTFSSIFANVDTLEQEDVLMGMSLVFWTITLVVMLKYVLVVLHANDHGEGSTFALYSNICQVLGIGSSGVVLRDQEHRQLLTLSSRRTLSRQSRASSPGPARSLRPLASLSSVVVSPEQPASPDNPGPNTLSTELATRSKAASFAADSTTCRAHRDVATSRRRSEDMARRSKLSWADLQDEAAGPPEAPPRRWWNWAAFPAEPIRRWFRSSKGAQGVLLALTILAPAMEMGDGVLTPAISVVSAVSGLEVGVSSVTQDVVIGVSIAILVLLFSVQFKGTGSIAFLFSPVVAVWLACNAAIGVYLLAHNGAEAFKGLSPHYIVKYFDKFGSQGWAMLGSVMLSVTGAEAMFSDLGHFSIGAVVVSWTAYVYPCLILTYLGQASYLLGNPGDIGTAYWSAVPKPVFWPMLVLATLASVVASQALISACFQICKQARALDFFPRVKVVHTSEDQHGQIYIAPVNWALMVLCIVVVGGFKADPTHLGNAYGLTISMVMLVTTFLVTTIMLIKWELSALIVVAFFCVFALIDGAFASANFNKVPHGGWVAIAITLAIASINFVWWRGQRKRMSAMAKHESITVSELFTVIQPLLLANSKPHQGDDGSEDEAGPGAGSRLARNPSRFGPPAAAASDLHAASAPFPSSFKPSAASHALELRVGPGPVAEAQLQWGDAHQAAQDAAQDVQLKLLRGEMQLALTITPTKPLVRLPGVGLYYSPTTDTVPAVLRHFMRNVEAMHQVNIFLCVRHLPVPFIDEEDRLLVRLLPGLPNTYQVVARYGYMDVVRHGQEFVDGVVEALVEAVEAALALPPGLEDAGPVADAPLTVTEGEFGTVGSLGALPHATTSPRLGIPGPRPSSAAGALSGHLLQDTPVEEAENQVPRITITNSQSEALPASPPQQQDAAFKAGRQLSLQVPFQPPRLQVDLSRLSRAIGRTSLARFSRFSLGAAPCELEAPSASTTNVLPTHAPSAHGVAEEAAAPVSPSVARSLEEATLRVAHLQAAAQQGVVYYFGRTSLRMVPDSGFVHDLLYEHLYKPMLLLSYAETESWQVPVNNLVELGMVLHI